MEVIKFLASDNLILDGLFYKGDNTNCIVIAIHGLGSNCFKSRNEIMAKIYNDNNIDYFCFNNRGSNLFTEFKDIDGNKIYGGCAYENPADGLYDIQGAVKYFAELGYENIYLQGHSLGAFKTLYMYKNSKNYEYFDKIKGLIILSLVDLMYTTKLFLNDKLNEYLELAINKEKKNELYDLMPFDAFLKPISVKTFLQFYRDNKELDIVKFTEIDDLKIFDSIKIPLFFRWGNVREMVVGELPLLVDKFKKYLVNDDIDFIDGANHNYKDKEAELAKQIVSFIKSMI